MNSCAAQSDFDLTQINLNKDKITDIAGADAKEYADDRSEEKKVLVTKKSKFLYFNNISFEGQQNPDNNDSGINGVSFYYNNSDDIVYMYNIHIYSLNEAEQIIKTVQEKLGKPNYSYRHWSDKDTDTNDKLLWEDQDNKILYCLDISTDSTTKVSLYVLHNFDDITKLELPGGPFGSWEDYLYERKKKKDTTYTYQNYLEELKVKDPDDYTLKVTK